MNTCEIDQINKECKTCSQAVIQLHRRCPFTNMNQNTERNKKTSSLTNFILYSSSHISDSNNICPININELHLSRRKQRERLPFTFPPTTVTQESEQSPFISKTHSPSTQISINLTSLFKQSCTFNVSNSIIIF